MGFARKLGLLRNRKGLTQAELGKLINVTPQAVSKWENGISEPDIATIGRIARIFGVTVDYVLLDERTEADATPTKAPPVEKPVRRRVEKSEDERRYGRRMCCLFILLSALLLALFADLALLFS